MMNGRVLQVCIGKSALHGARAGDSTGPWSSAIVKRPVSRAHVGHLGLEGDEQENSRIHGGIEKAVCLYPSVHYPYWAQRLSRDFAAGAFGENLTVDAVDEASCSIGDRYRVGTALLEISQPRSPCWKLARLWGEPELAAWFQGSGRTGWYLRVLEEGLVGPDDRFELVERPTGWATVELANRARYGKEDPSVLLALSRVDRLGSRWRAAIQRRLAGHRNDAHERLYNVKGEHNTKA